MTIRMLTAVLIGWGLCLSAGCGDSMQPVRGTVHLDGEPLADAAISFTPVEGGRPAMGKTDASGQFTLASFTANDGLPPGSYKVTVVKIDSRTQAQAAPDEAGEDESAPENRSMGQMEQGVKFLTPVKLSSPATTDLVVEVQPGMEPVKLDLKSE